MSIKNKIIWMFNLPTLCGYCGGDIKGRSRGRINKEIPVCNDCAAKVFKFVLTQLRNSE